MEQRWETAADIAAARKRFEAAIPGWRTPTAHGIGRSVNGRPQFARVNLGGGNALPAVVLATVCGHVAGSAAYALDPAALGRAIELLAPAEACTAYEHPNLVAWRKLAATLGARDTVVAAFLDDEVDPPRAGNGDGDPAFLAALRQLAATG